MKKKFVILFLFIICVSPIFADLNDGLTAYYPFNGNANDESGNGNDGTVYGATLTTDRFGNENSAYSFNGIDNYISTSLNFPDNQNITISSWVYWDSLQTSFREIWSFWDDSILPINSRIFLGPTETHFRFGDDWTDIDYELPRKQWINIIAVIDSTNRYFYVNGLLYRSKIDATLPKYHNFTIAKQGSLNSEYFDGLIDDIHIYNRALSENEIQELYFNANFTSPETAYIGEQIQFTDTSTGSPTEWKWDFENDGIYDAFIQNPTHIYNSKGIYSVKLKINNASFVDSLVKEDLITVSYCPPADPDSVEINIIQPDAIISWAEVDTTECGSLITPDGYIVLFSENNEDFFFLTYTTELTYVHSFVAQFSPQMFYKVVAFKNYTKIQINYLKSLNSSKEKIKWSIVKQHLKNKKTSD